MDRRRLAWRLALRDNMTGKQPIEQQAANLTLALQHLVQAIDILDDAGLKIAVAHAQLAHDLCVIEAAANHK